MSEDDRLWTLTPHVCGRCYARILAREHIGEVLVYRCSNCGAEAEGRDPSVICACGSVSDDGSAAAVRCQVNVDRTPECPGEIVAVALGGAP